MTKNQFEVFVDIESKQHMKLTQRDQSKRLKLSLGVINQAINYLIDQEYIKVDSGRRYEVLEKGYQALEPYKVKKAIFIAAGFGSRMVPITLNTPKPLVLVHGKKIIETLLDAVVAVGIEEIVIVRGYLGEQFDCLLKKYPTIRFIDNPVYNLENNISSAYLVKDELAQSYVFESDLLLYDPSIIRKYEYGSNYLGMRVTRSDDWCLHTKSGYISKITVGGEHCYHMYGISFWSKEDAEKMKEDIEKVYRMPGGKEKYWDEVALKECISNYQIYVKEVEANKIVEIDTFQELKQIDPIYNV